MSTGAHAPVPSWQDGLDAALVARLHRPLTAPGIISLALSRRILATVDYFAGRLPLLDELSRRRGRAGEDQSEKPPIVHARRAVETINVAPVVERVDTKVVPRVVVQTAPSEAGVRPETHVVFAPPEKPQMRVIVSSAAPARPRESGNPPAGALPKAAPSAKVAPSRLDGKRLERPLELRRPERTLSLARVDRGPAASPAAPAIERTGPAPTSPQSEAPRSGTGNGEVRAARVVETVNEIIHHRTSHPISGAAAPPVVKARDPEMVRSVIEVHHEVPRSAADSAPRLTPQLPTVAPVVSTPAPAPVAQSPLVHAIGRAPAAASAAALPAAPGLPTAVKGLIDAGPGLAPRPPPSPVSTPVSRIEKPPPPAAPMPVNRGPKSPTSIAAGREDLERVVDEVQRRLLRRLAAERERRGGLR